MIREFYGNDFANLLDEFCEFLKQKEVKSEKPEWPKRLSDDVTALSDRVFRCSNHGCGSIDIIFEDDKHFGLTNNQLLDILLFRFKDNTDKVDLIAQLFNNKESEE